MLPPFAATPVAAVAAAVVTMEPALAGRCGQLLAAGAAAGYGLVLVNRHLLSLATGDLLVGMVVIWQQRFVDCRQVGKVQNVGQTRSRRMPGPARSRQSAAAADATLSSGSGSSLRRAWPG